MAKAMAGVTVGIRGIEKVEGKIKGLHLGVRSAVEGAVKTCAIIAKDEAVKNAPVSPTQEQINNAMRLWKPVKGDANRLTRKDRHGKRRYRKRGRKPDAVRAVPGGLRNSITAWAEGLEACVFVPSNSPAGKYARRIHDEKGKAWHKRGIGTVAMGERADDKFIERAIGDNKDKFYKRIKKAVAEGLKK